MSGETTESSSRAGSPPVYARDANRQDGSPYGWYDTTGTLHEGIHPKSPHAAAGKAPAAPKYKRDALDAEGNVVGWWDTTGTMHAGIHAQSKAKPKPKPGSRPRRQPRPRNESTTTLPPAESQEPPAQSRTRLDTARTLVAGGIALASSAAAAVGAFELVKYVRKRMGGTQ